MYVPVANAVPDPVEVAAMVAGVGAAELVTVDADGYPLATLLPVVWLPGDSGGAGEGRLVLHMARANPHWREIAPGSPALAVVEGAQAYVSPSWYPSKAAHGRVVPTWNYSAVHLRGRVTVYDDPAWVRDAVTLLTETHERQRDSPWSLTDAPDRYVGLQLKAIVGLELVVDRVEAKAKLSQNRSEADRAGVVAGLRREAGAREQVVAGEMERGMSTGPLT